MDHAIKLGIPLIGINDSGGAHSRRVNSLAGYGEIFYRNTLASGVIPQISRSSWAPAPAGVPSPLTDFVFVVDKISKMFITGPEVIKTVLGEEISMENLGGARVQAEMTGNAHFYAHSEAECFEQVKRLVTYIPWNNRRRPIPSSVIPPQRGGPGAHHPGGIQQAPTTCAMSSAPSATAQTSWRSRALWAANIVVGFARMDGRTVGMIANQPAVLAGRAGRGQLRQGRPLHPLLRRLQHPPGHLLWICRATCRASTRNTPASSGGAKLLYAYSEATVPKITVILRRPTAAVHRHVLPPPGPDFVFAWPCAEIAVMGPEAPPTSSSRARSPPRPTRRLPQEKVKEYTEKFASPRGRRQRSCGCGHRPHQTRDFPAPRLEISAGKAGAAAGPEARRAPF